MIDVLWWIVVVELIGLAAFPLAYFLLPCLRDRGYSISKPLGLLTVGFLSWIFSVLHVIPAIQPTLWFFLLMVLGFSGRYVWINRSQFKMFWLKERRLIILTEIVFLAFFAAWAIFRSIDPAIDHTEQPMDFAFFNASIRTEFGHPSDPWLSGASISYYYFGYWIMGVVSELSGIASNISYNLSMALIPALAAVGIFGLISNVVGSNFRSKVYGIAGAIGGVVLLCVAGNLEGVLEFMKLNGMGGQNFYDWVRVDGLNGPNSELAETWMPQEFWWWFRATRVINTFQGGTGIDYTIHEFPFFSFMLGDLHPHVMSIPFILLLLSLLWNWLNSPVNRWLVPESHIHGSSGTGLYGYATLTTIGVTWGGLAFINMWDAPTFGCLILGVAIVKVYRSHARGYLNFLWRMTIVAIGVFGIGFLLYCPYYFGFNTSITGIHPVITATTRPIHMFIVWGLLLLIVIPFMVSTFFNTTIKQEWKNPALISIVFAILPLLVWVFLISWNGKQVSDVSTGLFLLLPGITLISLGIYSVFWLAREGDQQGKLFAMMLAVLGIMLIMGPEMLFIGDNFGTRMNTVFKLHYQAWILLSVASGYVIYHWGLSRINLTGWRRALNTTWAIATLLLIIGSIYYPAAAAVSKQNLSFSEATLDGLYFINKTRPAEYSAIEYLRRNARKDTVLIEAVGEWFDAALISRSTGIPTVFNWPGHQVQWRGFNLNQGHCADTKIVLQKIGSEELKCRNQVVTHIYQTLNELEAYDLLITYQVEYVYIGPREREKYGVSGLSKFDNFMLKVFTEDDVVIYQMPQS